MSSLKKEEYFKSKGCMYLFALLYLDGKQRNDTLGITREIISNKELVKEKISEIRQNIHDYILLGEDYEKSMKTLEKISNHLLED